MQHESIFRMNQVGYAPGTPVQVAVLTDGSVTVKDAAGNTVRTLAPEENRQDAASGDRVRIADLGLLDEGEYTLECPEESRKLTVRGGAWTEVTNALIKGLYYQRCGCELSPRSRDRTPIPHATPRRPRTGRTAPPSAGFPAGGTTRATTGNTPGRAPWLPRT